MWRGHVASQQRRQDSQALNMDQLQPLVSSGPCENVWGQACWASKALLAGIAAIGLVVPVLLLKYAAQARPFLACMRQVPVKCLQPMPAN
jgi:hypothetical protein